MKKLAATIQLMRPVQWVKNLVVFLGLLLGFRTFEADPLLHACIQALICFAGFCLVSSASYAINDVFDRHADAKHPTKRNRPLASGILSPAWGVTWGFLLAAAGIMVSATWLPIGATLLLGAYFVMILAYSLALKRRVILDVILIASGFVIRAWAGAVAVNVLVSPWMIACTFTICMFLGFGKRRCELAVLGTEEERAEHRVTLLRYTPELLGNLLSVSSGIAIVTFLLYTMDTNPDLHPPFPKEHLLYTLPLVVYGVFRYSMQCETGKWDGPTEILLHDLVLGATIFLWCIVAGLIVFEKTWLPWLGFQI